MFSRTRQHCLYFLPLPQGQGSFRPGFMGAILARIRGHRQRFRGITASRSAPRPQRYAHLAPDQRRDAVAKLNEKPIFALTLRLPWNGLPTQRGYPIDSIMEESNSRPRHYEVPTRKRS